MPVLLQGLFELLSFAMSNFNRADGVVIGFLEFDRSVPNVLAYDHLLAYPNSYLRTDIPSISFQAFKKSSGSENATNPYFAYRRAEQGREITEELENTFWLSLSRITRAFVKEVYLLKALASTSSETSLLRSPTKSRNHAAGK